jgi:hypothetical protein
MLCGEQRCDLPALGEAEQDRPVEFRRLHHDPEVVGEHLGRRKVIGRQAVR